MPWNLLILPLLGGFFFINYCYQFHFPSQRLEGYRLLMRSAVCGVFLLIAGRLATFAVVEWASWGRCLERYCASLIPFPFAGTAFAAFFIGLLLPVPWNWVVRKPRALEKAMGDSGDDLLSLLYLAAETNTPVYVTLDSRKVYVGFVLNAPNLEQEKTSVSILPLRSGYRRQSDLTTEFVLFYEKVYLDENVDPTDFEIAFPLSRVTSVHFYDQGIYNQFFDLRTDGDGPTRSSGSNSPEESADTSRDPAGTVPKAAGEASASETQTPEPQTGIRSKDT